MHLSRWLENGFKVKAPPNGKDKIIDVDIEHAIGGKMYGLSSTKKLYYGGGES